MLAALASSVSICMAKPEMRIDPYQHVAENQLPLAFDPHPDYALVAQSELKRVLG